MISNLNIPYYINPFSTNSFLTKMKNNNNDILNILYNYYLNQKYYSMKLI